MRKFLLFIYLVLEFNLFGQQSQVILEKQLDIKPAKYTLQEVFDILINKYYVNLTFDANSLPLNSSIDITKSESTVKLLLEKLKKNCPVEYYVEGQYIIIKRKVLKEKYKIDGFVTDSTTNESLPGASIIIENQYNGTTSDINGFYTLKLVPGEYKLIFKFIGYKPIEKVVELYNDLELNIQLSSEIESIQEVKITKQRNFWGKMDIGRNISTIDTKKIELLNTNNATDLLQARVPGVWSSQISGAPGDHEKVRVRGLSSLFACSDPLYVIDGVAVPIVNMRSLGISDLNVYDIEKITVLKDAASTAIYGFQGANGVVIIDTKRKNSSHISFYTKYGIQTFSKRYDLLNTKDFLAEMDTAQAGINIRQFYPAYSDTLANTNWQDKVFRDGAINEYQLTGSGSLLKTNFYISGNYYKHEGIVRNSNFNKYNIMVNAGRNITEKLSAEISYRGSIQKNLNNLDQYNGNDLILNGINKSPLLYSTPDTFYNDPPKKLPPDAPFSKAPQRTYYRDLNSRSRLGDSISTEKLINKAKNILNTGSSAINLSLKILFSKNIYLNASSSATFRTNKYESENIYYSYYLGPSNIYFRSKENYALLNQQINLNYSKVFGEHEVLALAGYKNYADNANWELDSINSALIVGNRESAENNYFLKNSLVLLDSSGSVTRYINAYASHINYNYKKKYYVSVILNYENLEVKKAINTKELFPSFALSWEISKEPGFNRIGWLNQFNIFANWGKVGNYPVNGIANNSYHSYNYTFNNIKYTGNGVTRFANHHLKSEVSEEYNIGTNLKFFNSRIFLSADYYVKTNSELIILRDIPYYYLGGKMMFNIGKIENKGYEISLEVTPISNSKFNWVSIFSISHNEQKVKDLGEEDKILLYSSEVSMPSFIVMKNQPLGNIMGYKYLGKWDKDTSRHVVKIDGDKYFNAVDSPRYVFDEKDQVVIGKSIPDYTWYWTNSFQYRNFSLDILWYGVAGVDKFNSTRAATYMAGTNREINKFIKPNRFTLRTRYFYQSSYFIEDASFIRLKQITISYLISKRVLKLGDVRLSVSLDNFYTITKYSGYDPEASIYTDNSFSDFAVDRGAYPIPRSVYFTLKLDL